MTLYNVYTPASTPSTPPFDRPLGNLITPGPNSELLNILRLARYRHPDVPLLKHRQQIETQILRSRRIIQLRETPSIPQPRELVDRSARRFGQVVVFVVFPSRRAQGFNAVESAAGPQAGDDVSGAAAAVFAIPTGLSVLCCGEGAGEGERAG